MDGGVDGDFGLQHTADHALHPVDLGGGGDFQGVVQAAALHQFDIHQVGGPHLHDGQGVLGREDALVGQNGDVGPLGDVFQPGKVVGLDGLLHKLNVQPLVLHLVQQADGLLGFPALIGVDADAGLVPDGLADGGQPGHVQLRVGPHLDLQGVVAPLHRVDGIPGHLLRGIHADGDIGNNLFPGPAHQLVDRNPIQLAVQVP